MPKVTTEIVKSPSQRTIARTRENSISKSPHKDSKFELASGGASQNLFGFSQTKVLHKGPKIAL